MNQQVHYDPATGLPLPGGMISPSTAAAIQQPVFAGVPQEFVQQREHYVFTLPVDCLPETWRTSGRPDGDRTFALTLLSTAEEEGALKAATQSGAFDAGQIGKHWMLSSVYAIGGQYTRRNFDTITKWMDDIGPKGRKMLDKAFSHLHTITDAQGEAFLAGMQRKG